MDLLKRRLDIAHVIAREFLGIQEKGRGKNWKMGIWLQPLVGRNCSGRRKDARSGGWYGIGMHQ